jgi:hypothetical protein
MIPLFKSKLICLFLGFFILSLASKAQLTWNVQMITPGKYEVDVTPASKVAQVSFKVSLSSDVKTISKTLYFTDSKNKTLYPGNTYAKYYYCDASYVVASGNYIVFYPAVTGGKADAIAGKIEGSIKTIATGQKTFLDEDKKDMQSKGSIAVDKVPAKAVPHSPDLNPAYSDLQQWLQGSSAHRIKVQVSIINQSSADGSHYFSAWGQSRFIQGSGNEGINMLSTEPAISLIFSDRETTIQGNVAGNNLQPFSIQKSDLQIITLDIARNEIISKSMTWNYSITYSNLTRTGNIIYGVGEGSMIILNLLKY